MLGLCIKIYCCYDTTSNKLKLSSKGLNYQIQQQSGDGPLEEFREVLDERVSSTSTNKGFRTKDHTVAIYEETNRGKSYFQPKGLVEDDGSHTYPLTL